MTVSLIPIARPDSLLVADLHPSPNIEPRKPGYAPSILVMHYTGLPTVERAIDVLSRPDCKVSCHYVIDEDGRIIQMVAEEARAWHAGVSYWGGETDINSASIGIEIQNPGHMLGYPDFPAVQMRAVSALARDITRRHDIPPHRVLAHSDIAPGRKIDPGEKFDWPWLAGQGVGLWVAPSPVDETETPCTLSSVDVAQARDFLTAYGYKIDLKGSFDSDMQTVVRAFQLHFRPAKTDGKLDRSTLDTLSRLCAAAGLKDGRIV
ncbi:N-acetylmuramoyl-L-alanine amidase [Hyphomicrobium sp.]|uniref:N-acetylmuramoyl-L-alanine amidase n=1 Tax=Hyphomicrobium sp. TaxID=82 RepID=UPI002E350B37|nr:N-acetylmuramoyl-L-alanine amidase [Hyphomicrobium sp.]HEX2840018.1 N-acetylmuramoyl-L-alanine amidase [Hyphomicrobium sp.]